jgi:hypothetical protein
MGAKWDAMTEPVSLEEYAAEADRRLRELADRPMDLSNTSSLLAFGSNGLLDVRMMDSKLGEERTGMFPGHLASGRTEFAGVQMAQARPGFAPLPPPRQAPSTRGYDMDQKEALEGLDSATESQGQNAVFRAASRQSQIASQFEADQRAASARQSDVSVTLMPRQSYYTDDKSLAPVGRGNTHRVSGPSGDRFYVDRNGDGTPDLILQYRKDGTYADFGDDRGLSRYDRGRYMDAPAPPIRRLLGL